MIDGIFTSTPVFLEEGSNLITIVAGDDSGNTVTHNVTVFVDNIPPVLTGITPNLETGYVLTNPVNISGSMEDLSDVSVWVNDTVATITGDTFFGNGIENWA